MQVTHLPRPTTLNALLDKGFSRFSTILLRMIRAVLRLLDSTLNPGCYNAYRVRVLAARSQ